MTEGDNVATIMEQALEALVARVEQVDEAIVALNRRLFAAQIEARTLARAVKEQRAAIARVTSGRGSSRTRPHARRAPAGGTRTRTVLDTIVAYGADISLGVLCQQTHMPSSAVRPIVGDLVKREYVQAVGEGVYRAVRPAEDKGE